MNRLPFQDSTGRRYSQIKAEEVRVNQRPNQQPRPAGWGTQPLRIPCSRFPCVLALNIPSVPPLTHDAKMS